MKQKVYYWLLFYGFGLVSLLPLWLLYGISDFFYIVVKLIGYRKEVVMENLRYSFPEKSEGELIDIRNKFYHHICDLFVETIKLQTMSQRSIEKRIQYENIEYLDSVFEQGRDILVATGHYGNWEWASVSNYVMKTQFSAIYKPLKNKVVDRYIYFLRSRKGTMNFTMNNVLRDVINLKRNNIHYALGVIADQTPVGAKAHYSTAFLNQNTPVHLGLEKMAVKFNDVVVFLRMDKIKRGYYKITFVPLFENPKDTAPYEVIDAATKYLESVIVENPEYWLWSHKRWKHVKNRALTTDKSDVKNEKD